MRRQKPVQAKFAPFVVGERCAFVQPLAVQEIHAAMGIYPTRLLDLLLRSHSRVLPSSSLERRLLP
jgi:hypothetical protein